MFATLAGDYPWEGDDAAALRQVLVVQVAAGFGIVADGRVHREPSTELAGTWSKVRTIAVKLGIEVPLKMAIAGPWARAATATNAAARGAASGAAVDEVRAEAIALRPALAELAVSGCPVVEIHEPASLLPTDEPGVDSFVAAHASMLDGLPLDLHATLAITGGDAGLLGTRAASLRYHSFLVGVLDGPESWRLVVELPADRGVVLAVGDASGRNRTGLEAIVWAAHYAASTQGGLDRVGIAPSDGLGTLDPDEARAVLDQLGEAARLVVGDPDALLRRMDPRAIDLRSAALGRYSPDPRSRRPG